MRSNWGGSSRAKREKTAAPEVVSDAPLDEGRGLSHNGGMKRTCIHAANSRGIIIISS